MQSATILIQTVLGHLKIHMKKFPLLIIVFSIIISCGSDPSANQQSDWKSIRSTFEEDFKKLKLSPFELGYVQNIEHIQNKDSLLIQEKYFQSIQKSLKKIALKSLLKDEKLDYAIIQYETALNLERIGLEKKWTELDIDSVSKNGLSTVPYGKEWYTYFLKRWVDIDVSPDEMFNFGLKEIERVESSMKIVQEKSGLDSLAFQNHIEHPSFYYNNVEDVQKAFETTKQRVDKNLENYFPFLERIPDVTIARGTNKKLAQTPGFYKFKENTFYYNYFDIPFNKRQISWIYIHEAMPGHHYQLSLEKGLPRSNIKKMFSYRGFGEGYASYVEEIGYEINAYQNIYDELGKWEWDIIRSVRVSLDVGLNYYNWSDERAMLFWQQHISGKDDIAQREIARMKRWPAQVITYKYGADKILKWKEIFKSKEDFNLKEFHKTILKNGSLPFSILEKRLDLNN